MNKLPRRKVLESYRRSFGSGNWFWCRLECGHEVTAKGYRRVLEVRYEAPSTVGCTECVNIKEN